MKFPSCSSTFLNTHRFILSLILPILTLAPLVTLASPPEHKNGTEVFEKWVKMQQIFHDRQLTELIPSLPQQPMNPIGSFYENNLTLLKPLIPFLKQLTAGQIDEYGLQCSTTMPPEMVATLTLLYEALEHNPQTFIDYLKTHNFSSTAINKQEESSSLNFNTTVDKYKALATLIIKQESSFKEDEYLFSMANRIFEYCFQKETFPSYQKLFNEYEHYPLLRFLHSVLWYHLVGDGWKDWHNNVIESLKQKSDNGDRIIYPAGGTDIYLLLQNGIYNITIIDPFLPSQERYYSERWEWLIRSNKPNGGINDEIQFSPPYQNLILTRTAFTEGEPFYAKLSTQKIVQLKKSITTWTVSSGETGKKLGTIIIDRRFAQQADFAKQEHKTIVMSYDELWYAITPDFINGWGIDPDGLADEQTIIVKQLRKPVSKQTLCNMHIASLMNYFDNKFINYASDPT